MYVTIAQTKKLITHLYKKSLNIIAPPFCAYCKTFLQESTPLCTNCLDLIQPIASSTLHIRARKTLKVFAIADYTSPLRELIIQKHWSNRVASHQLGELIWDHTYIKHQTFDIIIPVPLHWIRFAWRGFNQAYEIASVIAQKSNKPVVDCLQRVKRTPFQASLSQQERQQNVKNVFRVKNNEHALKDKHILIVDDLMTTGATMRSVAKELFKSKPASIVFVVVCRVI